MVKLCHLPKSVLVFSENAEKGSKGKYIDVLPNHIDHIFEIN